MAHPESAAAVNAAAASRDYKVYPRIDYRTITGGPLVIMENVKFPTYGEIVNVNLSDGTVRQGQILEVNKKKAIVQVFEGTSNIDNKDCHIEFTGDTLKMPISDDLMGRAFNGSGKPIDKGCVIGTINMSEEMRRVSEIISILELFFHAPLSRWLSV
eukprot:Skav204164  [mRNA]  locus=scaffold903:367503:371944:+ [translate_table: standard]